MNTLDITFYLVWSDLRYPPGAHEGSWHDQTMANESRRALGGTNPGKLRRCSKVSLKRLFHDQVCECGVIYNTKRLAHVNQFEIYELEITGFLFS